MLKAMRSLMLNPVIERQPSWHPSSHSITRSFVISKAQSSTCRHDQSHLRYLLMDRLNGQASQISFPDSETIRLFVAVLAVSAIQISQRCHSIRCLIASSGRQG